MKIDRNLTAGVAALLCFATTLAAQEEPTTGFAGELDVTEVQMDVLVTDPNGNVVLGLTADDFIITEGNNEIPVTSASFYSNRRFLESSMLAQQLGVEQNVVPSDRYFILFFHDVTQIVPALNAPQLDAARRIKDWVQSELLLNDRVAVVSYDVKLKVHLDFTTNRQKIMEAVDDAVTRKDPGTHWPSRQEETTGPSLLANLPKGKDLRKQTTRVYDGIRLLADATSDIVGRKNMIMFSIGFDPANRAFTTSTETLGMWTPDVRYWPPMIESLNNENVAVYAIDLISSTRSGTIQDRIANQGLSLLADDTGGQYYFHYNTFDTPLKHVADDNNGYYLLSYSAEHKSGSSGYQRVEVRTKNPQLKVRARTGYRYGT